MSNNCKRFSMHGMRSKAIIGPSIRWQDVIQLMAKKQKKSKRHQVGNAGRTAPAAATAIIRRRPEIPAFWIASNYSNNLSCWRLDLPTCGNANGVKVLRLPDLPFWTTIFWFWLQRKQTYFHTYFFASANLLGILFLFGTLSLIWAANPDFWVYKWNKWYAAFAIFCLGYKITQTEKNLDTVV